jgi:hypothetical protein
MDDPKSYIVHLVDGTDPTRPLKHFATRAAAVAFAKQTVNAQAAARAEIWEMPVAETRKAIAALQMGEGMLVEAHGRPPTKEELQMAFKGVRWEDLWPGMEPD